MAIFTKIVLCASSQQLTAGVWKFSKLQSFQVFEHNDQGKQDFARFLQSHPDTKIHLLIDAVEEDYRVESLPHVLQGRREMVERRLNQLYRNQVFRSAQFISREKDKRKDDRYLFSSLSKVDFVLCWVEIIQNQQAPLAGVYMLSMMSQAIVKRMGLKQQHIILSERLNSGLRQTYLYNGHLRISRLAPLNEAAQSNMGFFYLVETDKTRLYLISQRFVTRDTKLNMVLPSLDTEASRIICRNIEQEQAIECEQLDLAVLARSVRLAPALLKNNPELLHMHLLASGYVPDSLAPAGFTKQYQVNVIRQIIHAATALVILGGIWLVGLYTSQSMEAETAIQQAATETRLQEYRYNEVAKDFPATPIASTDLQAAVDLHQVIQPYADRTPLALMKVVSKALANSPEIQINRLHWVQSSDINLHDTDSVQATVSMPQQTVSAAIPQFAAESGKLYVLGFINGEIRNFTGDYRSALNSVSKLVDQLKADSAVAQVDILQAPVNVSSYSNLQGSTSDETASQQSAATFKLKVILHQEAPKP